MCRHSGQVPNVLQNQRQRHTKKAYCLQHQSFDRLQKAANPEHSSNMLGVRQRCRSAEKTQTRAEQLHMQRLSQRVASAIFQCKNAAELRGRGQKLQSHMLHLRSFCSGHRPRITTNRALQNLQKSEASACFQSRQTQPPEMRLGMLGM